MKPKKRQLRNEWRRSHRIAPRREIGRRPNWVFREVQDRLRSVDEELRHDEEEEMS